MLFTHTVPFAAPVLNTSPQSTATSIIIAGSYPSGSVVSGFVVHWQKNVSIGCSDVGQQNIDERGRFSRYVITGVEPGNRYSITVRLYNAAGSGPASNTVSAMTKEDSEKLISFIYNVSWLFTVPSRGPTSIIPGNTTPTSITVHWQEVPCLHRNGEITGYIVQVIDSNDTLKGTVNVSNNAQKATVSGLTPSTLHTVQVAAVNIAGIGAYSSTLIKTTGKF